MCTDIRFPDFARVTEAKRCCSKITSRRMGFAELSDFVRAAALELTTKQNQKAGGP